MPLPPQDAAQSITIDDNGMLTISRERKGQAVHIKRWNEAWRIFSTIAISNPALPPLKQSKLALDLLRYGQHINSLHDNNADWRFYDDTYRRYVQHNQAPFSAVDHTLVMEARERGQTVAAQAPRKSTAYSGYQPNNQQIQEAKARLRDFDIPVGFCLLFLAGFQCPIVNSR